MKLNLTLVIAGSLASAATLAAVTETAVAAESKITILNDAFGDDAAMKKDWGFSALVEVAGKRILFDTGNDRDIFAANVKAKNIDLTNLDFVVLSHRHSDHMAGLSHVLSVNPKVKIYAPREGFGIYGSSLPSSFYRKDESLPPQMRYYDGKPPEVMTFGTAWQGANFEPIEKTTEVAPGITLIALVSDAPGTRELRELSLAVNTADGLVLLVACSHPGIDKIVEAAAAINPKIHLIAGGFHLVVAPDDTIADCGGTQGHLQGGERRARPLHGRAHLRGVEAGIRQPVYLCRRRHFTPVGTEHGSRRATGRRTRYWKTTI